MAENQVLSPSSKLVTIRWMNACRTQASSRSYKVRNKVLTIAKKEFIALFCFLNSNAMWSVHGCQQMSSITKKNFFLAIYSFYI